FTAKEIDDNTEAGLIQMKKLAKPLYISYNKDTPSKCIADNGYSWLQVARKDSHVWITAMFNENDELLECYFDITNKNIILPDGESSFEDLYLDVVFFPNGQIDLLDEDELEDACVNGVITQQQVESAYNTANILMDWLKKSTNQQILIDFCKETYFSLKQ
ncbi:DUF402 domain-containing protein, partial [Anaerorhabdus sp.]